jgi:hypothetical protein
MGSILADAVSGRFFGRNAELLSFSSPTMNLCPSTAIVNAGNLGVRRDFG